MAMQKEMESLSDDLFFNTCKMITKDAKYLSSIIDQFSKFAIKDEEKESFDIQEAIEDSLNMILPIIESNNIEIIWNKKEGKSILGYKSLLQQSLLNIFNNSIEVLQKTDQSDRYLFISTSQDTESVIIKIKDCGGGIDKDILPKIFEPYFTTKHQSQGTGLGLNIVYRLIVDNIGGAICVDNVNFEYNGKEYKGAEFIISIPVSYGNGDKKV
jgi:signal transduction histidine kinase